MCEKHGYTESAAAVAVLADGDGFGAPLVFATRTRSKRDPASCPLPSRSRLDTLSLFFEDEEGSATTLTVWASSDSEGKHAVSDRVTATIEPSPLAPACKSAVVLLDIVHIADTYRGDGLYVWVTQDGDGIIPGLRGDLRWST